MYVLVWSQVQHGSRSINHVMITIQRISLLLISTLLVDPITGVAHEECVEWQDWRERQVVLMWSTPLYTTNKIPTITWSITWLASTENFNRMDIPYFNRKAAIIPIFQNTPLPLSRSRPDDLIIQEKKELPNKETEVQPHQRSIASTTETLD